MNGDHSNSPASPTTEQSVSLAPLRMIAPYTTVKQTADGIEIHQHGEPRVSLTREALSLLIAYIERAQIAYNPEDVWPGVAP